jgi:hypothetical protein
MELNRNFTKLITAVLFRNDASSKTILKHLKAFLALLDAFSGRKDAN